MSQKTLFTKSALAVAVALISTQAWSAGFRLNGIFFLGRGAYSGRQLPMMRVTSAVTCIDYYV